ncbi:MAG: HEAT repeat domain-containing protein [Chloroflexota bacterium]|nr:HEAT repeat domain-containing protein [Chloroflexota bacterium]
MSISNPPRWGARILTRLFSIQPGEQKKALLLYGLHFAFWLGLRWGDTASYTLFLNDRGAEGLSLMFIGNAVLAFVIGLVYNSFADRISNERLLLFLIGLTIIWLLSVQILLLDDVYGGPGGLVYPYFYLAFGAIADLTSLHVLNYISDFYDTRSAKRALPFLLSAGFAGAIVAGIGVHYLVLQYIPLAWVACLVVMAGFVILIRRGLPTDVRQIERARQANRVIHRNGKSNLESLRAGFGFVRASGILRWLALSTLVLVVLMKLLTFQASQVFEDQFRGDPEAFKDFNGTLGWVSNVVGMVLPPFVFRPILSHLGVGITSMVFPLVTLLSVSALGYFPDLGTAIFGRLTDRIVKKVFRNPVNAMLYNSVPPNVKSRARGLVNGLVVPLGTLVAGLLLLAARMRAGWFAPEMLAILGALLSIAYVLITLRVRQEYGRALADMLSEDELNILRVASQSDSEWLDPATLRLLHERLDTAQDDRITIFLAKLLYDLQGREAFGRLQQLAMRHSPQVRASIIHMLGADWIDDPVVHELCVAGLSDSDAGVRQAATITLAESHDIVHNDKVLNSFLIRLDDPDDIVQATVIPPLMASGDFFYLAPAAKVLSGWLSPLATADRRALGLRVLFKTGDERLARTLVRYLSDPAPLVRGQAAELIGDLMARSSQKAFVQWGRDTLHRLLSDDDDDDVRLAAVNGLGQVQSAEASRALLVALGDRSFQVRRQACAAMQVIIRPELERALDSDNPDLAESAAFMLARDRRRVRLYARLRVGEHIEELITNAYRFYLQCASVQAVDTAGMRLLTITLWEEGNRLIERAFWLVRAISDAEKALKIRQSLQSDDPATRANAVETLETITSPRTACLVAPLYDGTPLSELAQIGQEVLEMEPPSQRQVFCRAWPQLADGIAACECERGTDQGLLSPDRSAWLTATAMYALVEMNEAGLGDDPQLSRDCISLATQTMLNADVPVVRETARLALARLNSVYEPHRHGAERPMLTIIEKVIYLKKVPVFQRMSIDELRLLADISEEATYTGGQQILAEGERGDGMYLIVNGKVAIQRQTPGDTDSVTHLATLDPGEHFAEMSLFDDEPHSADAVALEPTELLLVRQAPLVAVIKRRPELALGLFRVLSQRLRRANEIIAQTQSTSASTSVDEGKTVESLSNADISPPGIGVGNLR